MTALHLLLYRCIYLIALYIQHQCESKCFIHLPQCNHFRYLLPSVVIITINHHIINLRKVAHRIFYFVALITFQLINFRIIIITISIYSFTLIHSIFEVNFLLLPIPIARKATKQRSDELACWPHQRRMRCSLTFVISNLKPKINSKRIRFQLTTI